MGLTLVADPLGFLERTQRDFGDVVPMRLAGQDVVLVASPSAVEEVLISKSDSFQKKGTAFFPGSSLAGEGLLVSDGEVWARQRRLSNPAFRQAAVGAYADAMASVTRGFLQRRWCRGGLRDVYADFNELTLEVVAETLFGADMRGPLAERITAAIKTAFEFFAGRASTGFIIPESVPTPGNIQVTQSSERRRRDVTGRISTVL